jgi:hypothetical protein
MPTKRQQIVLVALGAVYLMGVGALVGVVSERVRFDGVRNRIVRDLQDAAQRARDNAMAIERRSRDRAETAPLSSVP